MRQGGAFMATSVIFLLASSSAGATNPDFVLSPAEHVHMRVVDFPVGATVLLEHKAVDGTALTVNAGRWATVGSITIPSGGYYLATLQVRLPRGAWAEARMVRRGWGHDPDGTDETGYHSFLQRPDGRPTSDSFTHPLAGGGPLDFQLRLHPAAGGSGDAVQVTTIICKAHRTD